MGKKKERSKGKEVKIDRDRVKIGGKWIAWKEVENEERLRKEGRGQKTKDKGTTEQNFG